MLPIKLKLPEHFLEEEPKTLIVPTDRKELWAVELDLLSQLDAICSKYGIRYFIDGGTALGAVRHGGFVPWDDDLDVIMPRCEYNRLCEVAHEFDSPYFFQTNKTDPGSARGHAQLRNSRTAGILKSEMKDNKPIYSFNQGVFIDIFPFDNIPDEEIERENFLGELENIKDRIACLKYFPVLLSQVRLGCIRPLLHRQFYRCLISMCYAKLFGRDALNDECERLETIAQRYVNTRCKEVAPITFCPHHRERIPATFFDETVYLNFEFLKLPAMKCHKEALRINYGDWHKHVIGADRHGGMFVDLYRPYTAYLKK